ncbi:MAG: hypothetical protein LUD81_03500 [Clostridiales bacterium]|nr:hypothetical protein [Clostridiales bacterium]
MSKKNTDTKNKWRNKTIAFRISPQEEQQLSLNVKLCGFRTRQDYILQCLLNHSIIAVGNPLMFISFKRQLNKISAELETNSHTEIGEENTAAIKTMLEIIKAFEKTNKTKEANINER